MNATLIKRHHHWQQWCVVCQQIRVRVLAPTQLVFDGVAKSLCQNKWFNASLWIMGKLLNGFLGLNSFVFVCFRSEQEIRMELQIVWGFRDTTLIYMTLIDFSGSKTIKTILNVKYIRSFGHWIETVVREEQKRPIKNKKERIKRLLIFIVRLSLNS